MSSPAGAAAPQVSVILPVYNGARYVAAAIESVLAQTFRDWELLIVDDGSTDDTPEVLARYADRPAVTVIRQENAGLAGARNAAIRRARGELLALLDGDDEWLPPYLETMTALAARRPEAAVYYGRARCMDTDGRDLPQAAGALPGTETDVYQALLRANFLVPSATVARRAPVVQAGLFDAELRSCEDWDLWLRLARAHTFAGTSACLARYRLHGASLSADAGGMLRAAETMVRRQFGPAEDDPAGWPPDKRRAYGGLYRHHALTLLLRAGDWERAAQYLAQAFPIDPTLALDLDLFYELALGPQPLDSRGASNGLDLPRSALRLQGWLEQVFGSRTESASRASWRAASGTAFFALGLAAYNAGQLRLCRGYLLRAVRLRPALWREPRAAGALAKSFLGRAGLAAARRLARSAAV